MLTEDYLIRRINQAIALLLHAVGLRKNGQIEAALTDVDIALELLVGMRSHLIKEMSDTSILHLLTVRGELDLERLAIVADLFKEEGQLYLAENQEKLARQDFVRALSFSLEIALADMDTLRAEQIANIAELSRWCAGQPLSMELQVSQYNYLHEILQKDDGLLSAADVSRESLESDLAELKKRLSL
jgi:hypothetical protein